MRLNSEMLLSELGRFFFGKRLRLWCHPRLLHIPEVQGVVIAEPNWLRSEMETREAEINHENGLPVRWRSRQ